MVNVLVVALCIAAVAAQPFIESSQNDIVTVDWCTATRYCQNGYHCCSPVSCCSTERVCCGGGLYCCLNNTAQVSNGFSNSPLRAVQSIPLPIDYLMEYE